VSELRVRGEGILATPSKRRRAIMPIIDDALCRRSSQEAFIVGLGVEGLVARCRGSLP